MKKSFAIIALAALVMLAGCKKNDPKPNGTRLIAGIEKHKSDSKTSLDGLQIKWTAGDKLYVYDKDAEEGAIFTLSSGEGTSTGEFTGTYNFTNENVAVYPSSSFRGSGGTIVTMSLHAVQTASGSGTFGNGANPMLGVFSDMDNLTLTSLCGVLCLQLTGNNVAITAIEIVGGPADKLNGTFTANYKDTDPALAKSGDDGNNTVRLNCPATLTSTAQKFYVVLPAGTLANGFTMKVYNGTNVIFTKSTTHDITMHLNTIETMDPLHIELWDGNLSTLTGSEPAGYATATNGMTITGTLAAKVKISIAAGAEVTLNNAIINNDYDIMEDEFHNWAGLNCLGNATIVLNGSNTIKGLDRNYPGILVPQGNTLTIQGGGSLTASSNGDGAGIGGGSAISCGNIVIDVDGGTITATGGSGCAGIGAGCMLNDVSALCGNITITRGTIVAQGGDFAPGIGGGQHSSCGDINIASTVSSVTATKGAFNFMGMTAPYSIGKGYGSSSTCGTITIGGINYGTSGVTPNQGDGLTFVYPVQETTITWNSSFINSVNIMPWGHDSGVSTSNGGITATFTENAGLSSSGITIGNSSAYGITFSTTTGNISKIEIYVTDNSANGLPSGWSYDETETKVTWQGTSAPSVTMNGVNAGPGEDVHIDYISQIVFTVQ